MIFKPVGTQGVEGSLMKSTCRRIYKSTNLQIYKSTCRRIYKSTNLHVDASTNLHVDFKPERIKKPVVKPFFL